MESNRTLIFLEELKEIHRDIDQMERMASYQGDEELSQTATQARALAKRAEAAQQAGDWQEVEAKLEECRKKVIVI